jgi:fructose-1,6-bisphosphatase/inositol monophosphatase family enzyme
MIKTSYIQTIKELTEQVSKEIILPFFRNPDAQNIITKEHDLDVVTLADINAEKFLIKELSNIFPNAYTVGEETISKNPNLIQKVYEEELVFLLDPIDGTLNYSQGSAMFGTIISIISKGNPIGGMIYDPVMNDWVIAEIGSGAYYENKEQTKKLYKEKQRTPIFINNIFFTENSHQKITDRIGKKYGLQKENWTSAHDYRFLAMGTATGCISASIKPWDHAAGYVILEETGGKLQFLDGEKYNIQRQKGTIIAAHDKSNIEDMSSKLADILL